MGDLCAASVCLCALCAASVCPYPASVRARAQRQGPWGVVPTSAPVPLGPLPRPPAPLRSPPDLRTARERGGRRREGQDGSTAAGPSVPRGRGGVGRGAAVAATGKVSAMMGL